jgi:signal transduction histidine kinase
MTAAEKGERGGLASMGRGLRLYVGAVVLASGVALSFFSPPLSRLASPDMWIWLLICLGAEFLWLETISGEATDSMASTVNFAVIFLFGHSLSLWIVGLSVFLATRFIQRRNMVKSVFGFSQMVLTTLAAGLVFEATASESWTLQSLRHPLSLLPCVAAFVVYTVVNTGLVSGAVALEKGMALWPTWKTNYGYRNFILSAVALFILSPLLLIAYLAVGYWGVLLFFLPMLIVKKQNQEYIELQRTTQALISTERMAAKGEMAAEIAHELGNYLAILSGRAQLLQAKAMRAQDAAMARDAQVIRDQVQNMSVLTKGLLEFSHKEVRLQETDLNELTRKTVEFLKPQNRFDNMDIQLDLDEGVGTWSVDAGQIQQVLINLIKNAADAILEDGRQQGTIRVVTRREPDGSVLLVVEDDGPGVPPELRDRVFEPSFTTKKDGHGFGLSTCYRILENHGGRIWVEASPLGGARFVLLLPAARKAA